MLKIKNDSENIEKKDLREVKKMKQGMAYSCKEKTIILNVFKYFRTEYADKSITEIVRRTARATGCSEKSIFQFRKEEASVEGFKEPSRTKIRKNVNINSRDVKYDGSVRQTIRNIVYDLKYRNIAPSLNEILRNVIANEQLPNFSLMTLRRLLFDMGFYYAKNGNKSVLLERNGVVNMDNLPSKTESIKWILNTSSQPAVVNKDNLPSKTESIKWILNTSSQPAVVNKDNLPSKTASIKWEMNTSLQPAVLNNVNLPSKTSTIKGEMNTSLQPAKDDQQQQQPPIVHNNPPVAIPNNNTTAIPPHQQTSQNQLLNFVNHNAMSAYTPPHNHHMMINPRMQYVVQNPRMPYVVQNPWMHEYTQFCKEAY